MQQRRTVIYMPIDELKAYEKNPRKNKKAIPLVAKSIKEFGFNNPVVIDKDNVIVCGHTRVLAAQELQMKEVPVIMVDDLSPAQVKAFRLADNKVAEIAEWDFDLLGEELLDLQGDFNMEDFGFDIPDISEDAKEDDFDIDAAIPEEPKSKLGQIYKLGNHRLMCGDSTSAEDVAKLMNEHQADLLITDPPYNVDYEGGTGLKIENDHQDNESFHKFLFDVFTNAMSSLKTGASFYVWYASREVVNFQTSLEEAGFQVREELIWNKNSLVLGRQDYQWKHEPCLYGWKDGASHCWYNDRKQTTVLDFDRPTASKIHPTMKPIPLFDYQIKNSSKQGDIVLDLFGGSGTTIMACEQNGRTAYSMEFDPRYVDAIINRWETFTGQKAELVSE